MFPYYQLIKDDFKLPYDDTVGIQQLYGNGLSYTTLIQLLIMVIYGLFRRTNCEQVGIAPSTAHASSNCNCNYKCTEQGSSSARCEATGAIPAQYSAHH